MRSVSFSAVTGYVAIKNRNTFELKSQMFGKESLACNALQLEAKCCT